MRSGTFCRASCNAFRPSLAAITSKPFVSNNNCSISRMSPLSSAMSTLRLEMARVEAVPVRSRLDIVTNIFDLAFRGLRLSRQEPKEHRPERSPYSLSGQFFSFLLLSGAMRGHSMSLRYVSLYDLGQNCFKTMTGANDPGRVAARLHEIDVFPS